MAYKYHPNKWPNTVMANMFVPGELDTLVKREAEDMRREAEREMVDEEIGE